MNRDEFIELIQSSYGITGSYPWAQYPTFQVFRHPENQKWFAVVMELPCQKLGLSSDASIWVVNLKCDTRMIAAFREEKGIYPGYHMHKGHWLSVCLDGSAKAETVRFLLAMSYDLTY